ncbi:hypothetical protein D9M69_706280 [compost metagenome]
MTLHSIAARASPTRGTLTRRLSAGVRPANPYSLAPGGKGAEVWFICGPSSRVTRFQTNSPVSEAFRTLSFHPMDEKPRIGGS